MTHTLTTEFNGNGRVSGILRFFCINQVLFLCNVGFSFLCVCCNWGTRESELELLQRYRRDRRVLLNFMLSGSLIKKVILPPGAVSLDDVDLDQVSVDYVLNCVKKGGRLSIVLTLFVQLIVLIEHLLISIMLIM